MNRKRCAILISGRGSNMAALIAAAKAPDFPAEIALVISNRPESGGLAIAEALMAAGAATLGLGLIVTFPLVGHASWHAFRDVVRLPELKP